jgi:hypothetical protein
MEAVTGADLKASIITTVQAAALGALLTTVTPDKLTGANRVLFVAGIGALLVGVGTAGSYGRNLWMSPWHENAAYLPP